MSKKIFIIVLVTLSFQSCDRDEMDKKQISQMRGKAVDTLIIDSNSFVLEAELWRDFMPLCPKDGESMISINWLINTNLVKIPDNITMVKQYVIYKDDIWEAEYENAAPKPSLQESMMERVSRDGPKWGPGIYVDVISQIHDSQTNKDYYIERKNAYVGRTD